MPFLLNKGLLTIFSLQVDPFSSVSAAHNVGENVRHQIHKSHPGVSEVFIHIGTILAFGPLFYPLPIKKYLLLDPFFGA